MSNIIANTHPGRAKIYLDGEIVLDSSGNAAETPTVIYNVSEGVHTVTFSRDGHKDITILANVSQGNDCHARAVLNTSMWSYPTMLSGQPSPGWPYIPVKQVAYGHMVASTSPDGAEIYVDGQPAQNVNGNIATTPASVTGITTGIHTITFRKVGYIEESVNINIQNGLYSDARATLQHMSLETHDHFYKQNN